MGFVKKLAAGGALSVLIFAVAIGVVWHSLSRPSVIPSLPIQYWGPGMSKPDNTAITPFKINISSEVIDDLHDRLELLPELTPPLEDANFRYGFNTNFLEQVITFWLNDYKWREREAFLNSFPQFQTQVSGLNIHFIHVKPIKVPHGTIVLPLLLLHGWPGSVREFYELIPLLTTPHTNKDFVFEVVAPSLPGVGFSEGASKQGLGAAQIAVLMKSLMDRLGFQNFYVQGGDWGSIIGSHMSILYPHNVKGFHSNMCFSNLPLTIFKQIVSSVWPSLFMNDTEISKLQSFGERLSFFLEETGYMHIQSTKPDTVGIALTDSPAGLASYILEKFSTWTDPEWRNLPDGGLTKKYSLANLLDNIMIYWITGSITTSMRIYSETFNKAQGSLDLDRAQCTVPTACVNFPNTLRVQYQPIFLLQDKYTNLVQVTEQSEGGHFPAFEEPQLLSNDIWDSVSKMLARNEN